MKEQDAERSITVKKVNDGERHPADAGHDEPTRDQLKEVPLIAQLARNFSSGRLRSALFIRAVNSLTHS
jgi:hypothetical protein